MEKGTKNDAGKPRMSLLPHLALVEIIAVLEYGAKKYRVDNWMAVENADTRYYNAAQRHIACWRSGETVDSGPESSGRLHLAHAICSLIFLMCLTDMAMGEDQ